MLRKGHLDRPCPRVSRPIRASCLRLRPAHRALPDRGRFQGPGELGDAVSSPNCPCLQKLTIFNVQGLDCFTIDSESLQLLDLNSLHGVRQITVVAPSLEHLNVVNCFSTENNQPVVNISASQLKRLQWVDAYDPNSACLGSMHGDEKLATFFFVYGLHVHSIAHNNNACLKLIPRFKAIQDLSLTLYIAPVSSFHLLFKIVIVPSIKKNVSVCMF